MITILMMSAKMATPGILKIKVFWNKGYDVITSSCDQSLVTLTFVWENGARYGLQVLHQCGKRVKSKSQKVLWAKSYICRIYRVKTGRGEGAFLASPHPE